MQNSKVASRETNRLWIPIKMTAKSTVLMLLFLTVEAVADPGPWPTNLADGPTGMGVST